MTPLNYKLIRDVIHLRGQVFAIALVVACGVSAFVAMRSNYLSMISTHQAYYSSYRFADVFASLKRAPDSLASRIAEIPGVATAQTRVIADVTLDIPGLAEPGRGRIISIPERQMPMLNDLFLRRGRYIEAGKPDEIIISEAFSKANNLNPGDTLAAIINGRWQRLRIVGVALSPEYVYEIRAGDMFPDSRRFGVMWMGRDALGPIFNMEGAFNDVSLSLSRDAKEAEVIERLDLLLEKYGGLGAYNRADQMSHRFVDNEIAELRVNSSYIPGIFLGVTAFLLHLVLSRLVTIQRDQIAVMKAFGYGNFTIGLHYLKLALAAVLGGIAVGIVVGLRFGHYLTVMYSDYFHFPVYRYEAGMKVILTAILISIAAASVGAIMAVWQAVKLPPAEAMRPEAPARFRAGFLERLGLSRRLSPAERIIVRNLARGPVKASLSAFGISLSVSLLVVGFFLYFDTIPRIIDLQFNTVYREDANVIFNEPRPARTRYELLRLPGVMRAEVYRTVPARLRFGNRMRRLALLGMEPKGELHRIVDRDYRVFTPPLEGLVVTSKLAEILGVKQGDVVTVEVLEGARPVRQIAVASRVDEVLGLSAYMDIHALNRLMHEGGTISGARLMIDSQASSTLYAQLKQTPAVSGVMVPEAMLKNFNETFARIIGTMSVVLIVFACIIAFGVVYNGARISLSERGRELASLRVLGFTQREVAVMLLGEQAILTLLAMPLGWTLGYGLAWLILVSIDTEMMRMPLVISNKTYAQAFLIIAGAACISSLLVIRRLRHLDLVEVLKTRE